MTAPFLYRLLRALLFRLEWEGRNGDHSLEACRRRVREKRAIRRIAIAASLPPERLPR
jgi:hypothetical protein